MQAAVERVRRHAVHVVFSWWSDISQRRRACRATAGRARRGVERRRVRACLEGWRAERAFRAHAANAVVAMDVGRTRRALHEFQQAAAKVTTLRARFLVFLDRGVSARCMSHRTQPSQWMHATMDACRTRQVAMETMKSMATCPLTSVKRSPQPDYFLGLLRQCICFMA